MIPIYLYNDEISIFISFIINIVDSVQCCKWISMAFIFQSNTIFGTFKGCLQYSTASLGYAKIFGLIREMAWLACIGMLKLTLKNLLKLTHRKMCHRTVQIRPTWHYVDTRDLSALRLRALDAAQYHAVLLIFCITTASERKMILISILTYNSNSVICDISITQSAMG